MKVLVNSEGLVETIQLPEESTQEEYQGLLLIEAPEDILSGDHYNSETQEWVRDSYQRDPQPDPEPEPEQPTTEERLAALEKENKTLQAQLEASIQSNQMLEDCLVEMAGVVYA
jgi:hypothetical protein